MYTNTHMLPLTRIDSCLRLSGVQAPALIWRGSPRSLVCLLGSEDLYKKTQPNRGMAAEVLQRLGALQQRMGEMCRRQRSLASETHMYKARLPHT